MGDTLAYKKTTLFCFEGIVIQAIATNLMAILFIPLMSIYGFSFTQFGFITFVNFLFQIMADIAFAPFIDKIGYKKITLFATITAFTGLFLLGFTPLFANKYLFILFATGIYAFSSGILEVILSPMISAMNTSGKGMAMSLLHSFYAWGQVATIIVTTLLIFVLGNENWFYIPLIWSLVPLTNFFGFLFSETPKAKPPEHRQNFKEIIFKPFFLIALFAIFFGAASEVLLNQWISSFMEVSLGFTKVSGDLFGMCSFAIMIGVGRAFYGIFGDRLNLNKVLIYSTILAFVSYIVVALSPINFINIIFCALCGLSVALLWPGAITLADLKYPMAGSWIFAVFATGGDIGAALAPSIAGSLIDTFTNMPFVSNFANLYNISNEASAMRITILIAAVFPLFTFICHKLLTKIKE